MAKNKDAFKEAKKAAKADGDIHVVVLMDESGSMSMLGEAVVTGVNTFLGTFREGKGTARTTVAWFDAPGLGTEPRTRFKIKAKDIKKVADLKPNDYNPRGMTPLYDAVVDTLNFVAKKERDDETVFIAIITDGMENASETTQEAVKEAIAQAEKKGWGIVFLGANIDAEAAAANLGLTGKGQSFNFVGTQAGMASNISTASSLGNLRRSAGSGVAGQSLYAEQAAAVYDSIGGQIPETDDDKDEDPEDPAA